MSSRGPGVGPSFAAGAIDALAAEFVERVVTELEGRLVDLLGERGSERPFDRRGLAAFLSCSVDTIDKLRADGLPRIRVGDCDRFEREAVMAWLRGRA